MDFFGAYFRHVDKNLQNHFHQQQKKNEKKKKHNKPKNELKNEWELTDTEMFILFLP